MLLDADLASAYASNGYRSAYFNRMGQTSIAAMLQPVVHRSSHRDDQNAVPRRRGRGIVPHCLDAESHTVRAFRPYIPHYTAYHSQQQPENASKSAGVI